MRKPGALLLCIQMATGPRKAACLQRTQVKWHFPPWLFKSFATSISSGLGKGTVWCPPSPRSIRLRQKQTSPTLTPASSLEFCPKSHWLVVTSNKLHFKSHMLNYNKYWCRSKSSNNYFHTKHSIHFNLSSTLQLSKSHLALVGGKSDVFF